MYKNLLKLTYVLTHNHADLEEMVRHMVFNIKCGSRDDHSKSFSFPPKNRRSREKLLSICFSAWIVVYLSDK